MLITRLKELRENSNLTQKQLSDKLGFPYSTYNNWEKGKREPNSDTLIKLAKFFDVSIDYILGLSDEKVPSNRIIDTVAAHSDTDLTEEEQQELIDYAKYIISKRK